MRLRFRYVALSLVIVLLSGSVMPFAGAAQLKQLALAIHNYHDYSEPERDPIDEFAAELEDADARHAESWTRPALEWDDDADLIDELIADLLANENELTDEELFFLFELVGP